MARTPRYLRGGFRSYQEATRRIFRKGSHRSRQEAVLRHWRTAEMKHVAQWLRDLRQNSERPEDGNTITYSRDRILIFFVAALVLNIPMVEAYDFIAESDMIRRALGYCDEDDTQAITGAPFPSRQTVMNLFAWMTTWGEEDIVDPITGEVTREVSLVPLEQQAYGAVPVQIAAEFGLDLSRVAMDAKRIKSPRRTHRGKRPDEGAIYMGRRKIGKRKVQEKAMFGRRKMSVVATDLPVIVESAITSDSEQTHAHEQMIGSLADRSDFMKTLAAERGLRDFEALDDALVVGDSAFNNSPTHEQLLRHGMYGAFRFSDSLTRKIAGSREVTRRQQGAAAFSTILDVCNDGVHFCSCDRDQHPHQRQPMLQSAGARGVNGYVYVQCGNPACEYYGITFYVPYRQPDKEYADGRRELGAIDYSAVTPAWRGLKDIEVAIFKGCQAIEHYHSQLLAKHGLGITDTNGRRKFTGDLRHRFYYALGDLIWNLTILFNLRDGFAHTDLDRDNLWASLVRNRRKLQAMRDRANADGNDSDAGDADASRKKKENEAADLRRLRLAPDDPVELATRNAAVRQRQRSPESGHGPQPSKSRAAARLFRLNPHDLASRLAANLGPDPDLGTVPGKTHASGPGAARV